VQDAGPRVREGGEGVVEGSGVAAEHGAERLRQRREPPDGGESGQHHRPAGGQVRREGVDHPLDRGAPGTRRGERERVVDPEDDDGGVVHAVERGDEILEDGTSRGPGPADGGPCDAPAGVLREGAREVGGQSLLLRGGTHPDGGRLAEHQQGEGSGVVAGLRCGVTGARTGGLGEAGDAAPDPAGLGEEHRGGRDGQGHHSRSRAVFMLGTTASPSLFRNGPRNGSRTRPIPANVNTAV